MASVTVKFEDLNEILDKTVQLLSLTQGGDKVRL